MSDEKWQMPEWMKPILLQLGHVNLDYIERVCNEKPNSMLAHKVETILKLRTAGLLLTEGKRDEYALLKEQSDAVIKAIIEQGRGVIGMEHKRNEQLKAENAALHSRCVMEENELFRDLRAENERLWLGLYGANSALKEAFEAGIRDEVAERNSEFAIRAANKILDENNHSKDTALGADDDT